MMSNLNITYKIVFDDNAVLSATPYTEMPSIILRRTFNMKFKGRTVNYMYIPAADEADAIDRFNDFNGTEFEKQF